MSLATASIAPSCVNSLGPVIFSNSIVDCFAGPTVSYWPAFFSKYVLELPSGLQVCYFLDISSHRAPNADGDAVNRRSCPQREMLFSNPTFQRNLYHLYLNQKFVSKPKGKVVQILTCRADTTFYIIYLIYYCV